MPRMHTSTLIATSSLDKVGGQLHAPAALPQEKRPGTRFKGSWLGSRGDLDWCGKSHPKWIRSPDLPAYRVSRLQYF